MVFFRDRWLSDRIGFIYGRWDDEGRAARDLVAQLEKVAEELPLDASIVIALDGENPWLHYPEAGGVFLRELMDRLGDCGPALEPATFSQLVDRLQPQALARIHPGSWINSVFATWIGHPEKSRAWQVLASVRAALEARPEPPPMSLLVAEGSDWFWWLGDDNPTPLAPLYDRIFRLHLGDACEAAGVTPPVDLDTRLKTVTVPLRVPVSVGWQPPVLDGRYTTYFEWSLAAWVEAASPQSLSRLAVWAAPGRLFLLVEGEQPLSQLIVEHPLTIQLQTAVGQVTTATIDASGCHQGEVACAVDRIAELILPWDNSSGSRLEVRLAQCSLPAGAALVLEPYSVDAEDDGETLP
jgi:hypothetical protein